MDLLNWFMEVWNPSSSGVLQWQHVVVVTRKLVWWVEVSVMAQNYVKTFLIATEFLEY